MSMFKAILVAASIATASTALAAPTTMSDAQYVAAARCGGLIASPALGKGDSAAIDAMLASQGRSRSPAVADRADEARSDAMRQAGHSGVQGRAALIAERDGVCQAWNHGGGAQSASLPPQGGVSN